MEENKDGQNPEKTFPETYVKELREENKSFRLKATETETKLLELQKQLEEINKKSQEEQGKFKELYETETQKAQRLEEELQTAKSYKEKYETFEKETKEELLGLLSDEHKEIAKDLPIESLRKYVKVNTKEKVKTDDGRSGGQLTFSIEGKEKWSDFSSKELEEIKDKNRPLFDKLSKTIFK